MGRVKKKGQAGAARNYMTRNQAIRKLQISLPDFRKLCIWKGIYPREPRDKKKALRSSTALTTFYYAKDIQYLQHEPLLRRFRVQKALEKKISKALGRGDAAHAQRLDHNAARPERTGKPRYTLNHVVRERYPTFADALRDLDDCLSMLALFSSLPSTTEVPAKMIARCERLYLEFQHYLIASQSLKKSFLSIKGIYYQASIQGEDVLWVAPYKFNQRVVGDVDFRIMSTFVEFYMTLLGFVNFRLYTSIGLKYPPRFDEARDSQAGELSALTLEGKGVVGESQHVANGDGAGADHGPDPTVQAAVNKVIEGLKEPEPEEPEEPSAALARVPQDEEEEQADGENDGALDKFEPTAPGGDILPQPVSSHGTLNLFSGFTVFLSRETPRQPLEFLLRAFGCKRIGWDAVLGDGAFTTDEHDPRITHQIVDRPVIRAAVNEKGDGEDNQTMQKLGPNARMPGRVYVQPQWAWDCVNDEELKQPSLYAPGTQLPPHLSPFVKPVQGQYDPSLPLEDQELEGEALETEIEEAEDGVEYAVKVIESGAAAGSDDEERESEFGGFSEDETEGGAREESDEDDEDEGAGGKDEEDEAQRQRELEAELAGTAVKPARVDAQAKARLDKRKALAQRAREEAEEIERAKGMMSKKKRKLFEKMVFSNNKKSDEARGLRAKRRRMESGQA